MVRSFCARGNHEPLKCGVHGAVGVLVAVCAVYNFTAWCFRRDRHLSVNAVIYTLAAIWEVKHTLHHLSACVPDGEGLHQASSGPERVSTDMSTAISQVVAQQAA